MTTTVNGDLVYTVLLTDNNAIATGVGTGFTERIDSTNGQQAQDQVQTSAGAINSTWTAANTTSRYSAFAASFKVAAAAAGVVPKSMLLGFG
jgi:hypothetical protein